MKIKKGIVLDSFTLTIVRVITALFGIVVAKLLAVHFSIEEYGIYSQAMLVATTGTSITVLGLTDATNYFYNKNNTKNLQDTYMATIFGIQLIVGFLCAIIILLFGKQISTYFNNPSLISVLPYIAFIPMLNNLMNMLQVLFISAGKAKALAIRNFILAIIKVLYVLITCITIRNVTIILFCLLIVEAITTIYMWFFVKKHVCTIKFLSFNKKLVLSILKYSIPMAGYIITNSLSRSMDKLVIGRMGSTSDLAIYSIASKELPFDLLTAAFVTVLIPYITRYIGSNDYESASKSFSKYIQISYLITWPIGFGAIIASKDVMTILYDDKYLVGLPIFIIYIIVDMIRFANVSLIFSAKAKTKELLLYSCSSLIVNIILNIIFYKIFGMIGPAIATVVIMISLNYIMLFRSSKLLDTNLNSIVNARQMILLVIESIIFGAIALSLRNLYNGYPLIVRFVLSYLTFIIPVLLLNYKYLISILKELNSLKMSSK